VFRRPSPDARPRLDDILGRVVDIGVYFFAQKKVAEEGADAPARASITSSSSGASSSSRSRRADVIVQGILPGVSLERPSPRSSISPSTS